MVNCLWCGDPFQPRNNGGKRQRFCSKDCRAEYFAACRAWGDQEHRKGRAPIGALRMALQQRARSLQRDLGRPGRSRGHPETRIVPSGNVELPEIEKALGR